MNKITQIFNELSDSDLKTAVQEMKTFSETGVLHDGFVRALARRIGDKVGVSAHESLTIAQSEVIRHAAYRWLES